jgi:hypothetical protein
MKLIKFAVSDGSQCASFIFTFHCVMSQILVAWQTFKSFRFDLPHKYTRGTFFIQVGFTLS